MSVTVLYGSSPLLTDAAREDGDRLWIPAVDLEAATGWTREPQGLCRGDACVALQDGWTDGDGRIDLTAFAGHLNQPVVHDSERAVWAFGASAGQRGEDLRSLQAPDFTLPDLDGEPHSLSDYRGSKVFLYTYGSFCGCHLDLPGWQVVYDELRDQGLVIIAVALDAGGADAVRHCVLAPDLAERPDEMRRMMGWSDELWTRAAPATYPCLIDEEHLLADLYQMTNVPMAVWIDEEGRLVRPSEPAGFGEGGLRSLDPETFRTPPAELAKVTANRDTYIAALRDWVAKGADSEFVLSPDEIRARMRLPEAADVEAAAHARIGRHLLHTGDHQGARQHFEEASRLAPDKWPYRRQSFVMAPDRIGTLNDDPEFFAAFMASEEFGFYPRIDMPGIV